MKRLRITGDLPVSGKVRISGNKNAALPMIAAALLTDEPVILRNMPDILDVRSMLEIAASFGATVDFKDNVATICTPSLRSCEVSREACANTRTSILFAAPLVARAGGAKLYPPGGDVIGRRRLDGHFYGLTKLGASASYGATYDFSAPSGLRGCEMFLDEASVTATEQIMIAAVTAFAVTPIYLFYLLKGNYNFLQKLESNLPFLSPSMRDDIIFFVRKFTEILTSFFRGQLVIAVIMGLLYGTGLTIAGVKFGFLLGIFAGFLNIVPYLGTIIGLSTILPTAFFQTDGGLILAAVALAIFIAVQMLEGYVLTPKIMGDRTGLHPTVIIFAVFFWGVAFGGILGMIMAIPLTAFIVTVWMRIMEKLRAYDKKPHARGAHRTRSESAS